MTRWRFVVGIVAALLIMANGVLHTTVGWKSMRDHLAATNAPADLITGLTLGWIFGGVAMFGFGSIAIASLVARRANVAASRGPLVIIALVYILFGIGALIFSGFDPFFLVFIVPGLMLIAAAWPTQALPR